MLWDLYDLCDDTSLKTPAPRGLEQLKARNKT
jgi:hypothetical protein